MALAADARQGGARRRRGSVTPHYLTRVSLLIGTALLAGTSALTGATVAYANDDPARSVNPFIGTGGHGHTFPGASLPFGMVQLSPDTRLEGWDGCSGYHYSDDVIYGFSHTHLSGTGVPDYCDILFMPVTGAPRLAAGAGGAPGGGYGSRFSKRSERAEPGWYAVELEDSGIGVELTATERAGLHRYRFRRGRDAHVIVDLTHRDPVLGSSLRVVGDRELEGFRRSSSWARDQVVYFVARFSRPFQQARVAVNDTLREGLGEGSGTSVKGVLSFGDRGGEILVKVGISAVDIDGARRNLDAELPGWDFRAVRRAARQRWDQALSRVEIEGGTSRQRTIFTTALYHCLLAPNVFSDVDGRYRGMDLHIHSAQGRRQYTVFSLWDTFRALHPLLTILEPQRTSEIVQTFLAQYQQRGRLPVWELAANETDCMIGYHSVSVIADAWLKGIRGFDAGLALDAMVHSATLPERGLDAYQQQGFVPSEREAESVSKTLEYAYDDWCIAQMAGAVGRGDVAAEFTRRSQAWRHLLDPQTSFMRARHNGRWAEPFDPRRVDNNYTEANAWQYGFFVPHDIAGLMEAMGGEQAFVEKLDALFTAQSQTTGREQADITGLIGQYAHGNEPSHHMAWLYHYAGMPWKSVERVRQILDTLYADAPDGLAGNEDCGQMSAWYVLSAMGLYPVCPGSGEYALGLPEFDKVTLYLDGGRRFVIETRGPARASGAADAGASGAAGRAIYVQGGQLNGHTLTRCYLRHDEIMAGGKLVLTLGPRPNERWGHDPQDRPHSALQGERIVAAPWAQAEGDVFRDSLRVELRCADPAARIRFQLAAGATPAPPPPRGEWEQFRQPLVLRDSATISFFAEPGEAASASDSRTSPVVTSRFHRIPNDWAIEVLSVPNAQYTAGGPQALIDGLHGASDWRTGGWQGYQDTDFDATVDLGRVRPLRRVGASFLQDVRSWIWMPAEVVVAVSRDRHAFREVARLTSGVSDREYGVVVREIVAELQGAEARYVRVFARNYGRIPDWHPGHGDSAFIFVDEIVIE